MSEHLTVRQLRHATQVTQEWLADLASRPPFESQDQAYTILRGVLHAVRDRLTVDEAAHLASQLPMVVRGFYYEGWRPALAPNELVTAQAFYDHIRECLHGGMAGGGVDLPSATEATLQLLADRIDPGALRHVTGQLPAQIRALFPEAARA
jgi:uncharacterized protein (DUF2267 family)